MALKYIMVKCPACGASLDVEEGRKQIFCSFCGAKVMLYNDNEYIYRHIDEAGIKQAETEKIIRLRELEMEEREENRDRKGRAAAYIVALVLVAIGAICFVTDIGGDGYNGGLLFLAGMLVAEVTFISSDSQKEKRYKAKMIRLGRIKLTDNAVNFERKDYHTVEAAYKALGFKNINVINMRDLRMGFIKKPGMVEKVTIDGESPKSAEWYDSCADIVITYHGMVD